VKVTVAWGSLTTVFPGEELWAVADRVESEMIASVWRRVFMSPF
jgi:hypothetical protein